ncbi:MAG: penicillin acylase family protein, partial [Gemmatimonadota bacterium]
MTTARGLRERIGGALLLLVLLAGAILTAGYLHLRTGVPSMEGDATLAGIRDSVEIRWDARAIPHVFATSERDALFAQGFVHARHRLWQLELLRRTARGRLAELFGEPALESDRLVRTLDLWGAARSSVSSLGPDASERLDAYVAGVNAGIDAREGPLPPEFLILGVEPGRWSPTAAAAVGKLMELDLSSWRRELARFHARQTLPEAKTALLRPRYPAWGPTTLSGSGLGRDADAGEAASRNDTPGSVGSSTSARGLFESSATISFLEGRGFRASNAWVLSGRRTASGRPILANDMHLDLRAPSTWYLVALHADEGDLAVAGMSIPGVPGVVVGYNRGVAWGFTNGMVDDMDFVVEAVNLDRSSYRTAEGWEPFAARPETIRVRGREEPVVHPVRETVRGPVVSDLLPDLGATLSALW